jgi:hypothetical protein
MSMEEIESRLKAGYPKLSHFLEDFLWQEADGNNPIELFHRVVYFGSQEYAGKWVEELKAISHDDAFSNEDISRLFNKNESGHPYEVVNTENAKDFCFSMSESLAFILSLKPKT